MHDLADVVLGVAVVALAVAQWIALARLHAIEERHRRQDLATVRRALGAVYHPAGIEIWIASRHPAFGRYTAEQMVRMDRTDEVLAEIERLTTGAFG